MQKNILLKNGIVLDPVLGKKQQRDIYIQDGKIVARKKFKGADVAVDVKGCLVMPGLIDFHSHVFHSGTEIGIDPDLSLIPQGVTTTVDAGSAGTANAECFLKNIVSQSKMRIKAFLNVCPSGLATMKYHENVDPQYWDESKLQKLLAEHKDILLGLKVRISKEIVGYLGIDVLIKAVALAERLKTRLVVHVTDPPEGMGRIAELLRPGDVLAHCYHGTGQTVMDAAGKVLPKVREAQQRGVIMDAANGGNHWSFKVAERALAEGFAPDIISTDLTGKTLFQDPVFSLPYIMSKYLLLGMDLLDVVARCTSIPAQILEMDKQLGSLQEGFDADIAVFKLCDKYMCFTDTQKETRIGKTVLVPQMTIVGGEILYRNIAL